MAAMTASVASSPIFLTIASSPFANNVATYEVAGSQLRLAAIVRASRLRTSPFITSSAGVARTISFALRCRILPDLLSAISFAINIDRVLEHRLDDAPNTIFEPLEETAMPACMTGDATGLFDDQEDRVVVAIEPDLAHALHVARGLAFSPKAPSRSRPIMRFARCCGAFKCFAVHPCLRKHTAGVCVLSYGRHDPVGVPVYCVEPTHVRGPSVVRCSITTDFTLNARRSTDLDAGSSQRDFRLADGELAVMEDRRREHCVGASEYHAVDEILQRSHAARRDHRNIDRFDNGTRELDVESRLGSVAIHAGKKNFAGAERGDLPCPLHGVEPGLRAPAVRVHLPSPRRRSPYVDRRNNALRSVTSRRLRNQLGRSHRRRVDADLVGPCIEQRANIVNMRHAAANGQWNEDLVGDRFDHVVEQWPRFHACLDVEEGELVGALFVIAARDFHRVAGVAQVHEVHAFDDASLRNVEAGNDAFG